MGLTASQEQKQKLSVWLSLCSLWPKKHEVLVSELVVVPKPLCSPIKLEKFTKKPSSLPCMRRDEKDSILISERIFAEHAKLTGSLYWDNSESKISEIELHMKGFSRGAWEAYRVLAELSLSERAPTNERLDPEADYWYELNTSNAALFQDMRLRGVEELLPGRLFTTRMPRDLLLHPENGDSFRKKVSEHSLRVVVVLAESQEYGKYAGTDIEGFYASLDLEVIHRPFEDFSIPDQPNMMANIKDVLWHLSEGRNVLVHCAGGSGRTGMLIAGVVRNVGVKDPVTWVRRVKSSYIETAEQEHFVNSLPVALDSRICERHPMLELAITAEFLLNLVTPGHSSIKITEDPPALTPAELQSIERAFTLIDRDKSGYFELCELEDLFRKLGVEKPYDTALAVLDHHEANGAVTRLSKNDFISLVSKKMVTVARRVSYFSK